MVVVLSLIAPGAARAGAARREPGARRAAREAIFHRARDGGRRRRRSLQGASRRSGPAIDPRIEPLFDRRDVRGDRRTRRAWPSRTSIRRRRASRCRRRRIWTTLMSRSSHLSAARDLPRAGPEPRVQPAAAARRREFGSIRDRRLDAAHPGAISTSRCGRRVIAALDRPRACRSSARWCWRSCCCGRST